MSHNGIRVEENEKNSRNEKWRRRPNSKIQIISINSI
jgi:hypothetical protein